MTLEEIHQQAAQESFLRGYLDIPDDAKLQKMSFVELAALLSSCESGSARFSVVERELRKHLAKDQAKINLRNVILGACIGGIFGLAGVAIGAHLKEPPTFQQASPSSTVERMENGSLNVEPPVGAVAPNAPPVSHPTANPASVQNNAQQSHPKP